MRDQDPSCFASTWAMLTEDLLFLCLPVTAKPVSVEKLWPDWATIVEDSCPANANSTPPVRPLPREAVRTLDRLQGCGGHSEEPPRRPSIRGAGAVCARSCNPHRCHPAEVGLVGRPCKPTRRVRPLGISESRAFFPWTEGVSRLQGS